MPMNKLRLSIVGSVCSAVSGALTYDIGVRHSRLGTAARRASIAAAVFALGTAFVTTTAEAQTSASAYTSATRYDIMGRVTGTIAPDPDGAGALKYLATRTTYDVRGNVRKIETGELVAWQAATTAPSAWSGFTIHTTVHATYDLMNRKLKTWMLAGGVIQNMTQISYDTLGRVECTAVRMNPAQYTSLPASACTHDTAGADGKDRITKNIYNQYNNRLVQVRKAVGTPLEQAEVTYQYTTNRKLGLIIDANGNRAQMLYDGHDRLYRWRFPSPAQPAAYNDATEATALATAGAINTADYEQYSYDKNGNRTQLRKRDAQIITYSYDALNRNTLKNIPVGTAADVYYGYDNRGLQTYARFASTSGQGISTVYDDAGRVTSTTNNMGGAFRTLSYLYDKNSNRTRVTHPDGKYFTYSYDGLNRSFDIHENGSTRITANRYNNKGQFIYNYRGPALIDYAYYDVAGRINNLSIQVAGTAQDNIFTFAYTPASQIKSRTTSNNLYANTAHYDVNRNYNVNGLNQYTSAGPAAFTYDANGNLTSDGAVNFTYDTENRLVSASGAKTASLSYDPLGRLYQVSAPTGTTRFLYDGDALVAEYDNVGILKHRYVHGNGVDQPLVWYDGAAVTASTRRHLFANWQGSISAVTDSAGNAMHVNAYDAYGIPNDTNVGRFQYTGQILLTELGMYHYKARIYSPYLGRFLQTDPIGYDDQFNLYAYVGNDPVGRIDPTGMATDCTGVCARSNNTGTARSRIKTNEATSYTPDTPDGLTSSARRSAVLGAMSRSAQEITDEHEVEVAYTYFEDEETGDTKILTAVGTSGEPRVDITKILKYKNYKLKAAGHTHNKSVGGVGGMTIRGRGIGAGRAKSGPSGLDATTARNYPGVYFILHQKEGFNGWRTYYYGNKAINNR